MVTLPVIAAQLNKNVHAVRSFLRRHRRDLLERGQRVGSAIGYDRAAAAEIRRAFEKRVKRIVAVAT